MLDLYEDSSELSDSLSRMAKRSKNYGNKYTLDECADHIEGLYRDFRSLLAYYKWNERSKERERIKRISDYNENQEI